MLATKLLSAAANPPPNMQLVFDTTLSAGTTVEIPLNGTVNVSVDWGDGNVEPFTTTGYKTHTYASSGTYTVTISGTLTRYGIDTVGNSTYAAKLRKVLSFGRLGITSLAYAFRGCNNLNQLPSRVPETVANIQGCFYDNTSANLSDVITWNTGRVTDTSYTFYGSSLFNSNIGGWDTGNVTDMQWMFRSASAFNANIDSWNTGNVINMSYMFQNAGAFNRGLNSWDTSKVTVMNNMFQSAAAFNGNVANWNTGNVTNMASTFSAATSFNGNLANWNTGKVTSMSNMFLGATVFNGNITNWNTGNVTNMSNMFLNTRDFNGNLASWDTSKVTDMNSMFSNARAFNSNIASWNTGNVTTIYSMFRNAVSFNQNIPNWNISKVTGGLGMLQMFENATVFNGNMANWNFSNISLTNMFNNARSFNSSSVTSWNTSNVTSMSYVFRDAISFNQNIGGWKTSNVTTMFGMFSNATVFNGNISNWDTINLNTNGMNDMFLSATNFNQNLTSWNAPIILTTPTNFATGSALTVNNYPVWGTTPGYTTSGSITYVGTASGISSATLPAHQAGDIIIAFAYRDGSTVSPTLPSGWTNLDGAAGTNTSYKIGYKIAVSGSETTGTWTNATGCVFLVYRGSFNANGLAFGRWTFTTSGVSGTVSYPANDYWRDKSWVIAFAGSGDPTTNIENAPSGLTFRGTYVDGVNEVVAFDSNGIVDQWPTTNVSITPSAGVDTLVLRLPNQVVPI